MENPSCSTAVSSISAKIGGRARTRLGWVKQVGVQNDMAEKLKALERGNRELRQVNGCLTYANQRAAKPWRFRDQTGEA